MIILELGFGAGLVLWLAFVAGPAHAMIREAAFVTAALAAWLHVTRAREGVGWQRSRYVARYGFVLWAYLATARLVPALQRPLADASLLAIDRALFGETPAVRFDLAHHPWAAELLSSAYLTYQPYLHVCLLWALVDPLERAPRLARLVFTTLIVGYVGYLLVPAVGPFASLPAFVEHPLAGGPIARLNLDIVKQGGAVYDVFPSLHTAVTLVLLWHDRAYAPRRFWVMLPVASALLASTVLLRFHYAIDVVAGAVLAVVVVAVATRRWGEVAPVASPAD